MPEATVETTSAGTQVHLRRLDGSVLLTHVVHRHHRPYLHPIMAPDGHGVLTEDRPNHHPWQHGVYTGLNLVNGIGFWKEFDHDGRIDPRLVQEPVVEENRVSWAVESIWTTPVDSTHLVTERQQWTFVDSGTSYTLDLEWRLHAEIDLHIGQYMAGGLFVRMPYRDERGGRAYNSEGLSHPAAERQRARWVAVTMPIEERADEAGMVVMDHPQNPDHPVTWRVDEQLGISPSRCIAGPWEIPKGHEERYRYRIDVFCGSGSIDDIEASWGRFAADS